MSLLHYLSLFGGGICLMNAVPHVISGVLGRAFQTPFATPSGKGLSSSMVNVLWGLTNLILAWVLLIYSGRVDIARGSDAIALFVGMAGIALFSAHHFGQFHGGNNPRQK
ncbi:hypothetical protein [Kosakonia quasisacchari]|uniref:hypothetical protein n=1 Tax=Kosakonia quasisacchari TaxID=2529380 RepID=UPI0039E084E8